MTPVLHMTRRTYIDVEALRHYLLPLGKSNPECAVARSSYKSIGQLDGKATAPCKICESVEAALRQ